MKTKDIILFSVLLSSIAALVIINLVMNSSQKNPKTIFIESNNFITSKIIAYDKKQKDLEKEDTTTVSIIELNQKEKAQKERLAKDAILRKKIITTEKLEIDSLPSPSKPTPKVSKSKKQSKPTTPIANNTNLNLKQQLLSSWNNQVKDLNSSAKGFLAVIHRDQLITIGDIVFMRNIEPIKIKNILIPLNTFITGVTKKQGNRLTITVSSINLNSQIIPLNLEVYSTDGQKGLLVEQLNSQTTDDIGEELLNTTTDVVRSVGGSIGNVIGNISNSAFQNLQREKKIEIHLLDKQQIILQ